MTQAAPWVTALEMKYRILRSSKTLALDDTMPEMRTMLGETARLLPASDVYAWTLDSTRAVCSAMQSLPDAATLSVDDMPSYACWWWFDRSLILGRPDDHEEFQGQPIAALVLGRNNNSIGISLVVIRWFDLNGVNSFAPHSAYAIRSGVTLAKLRDEARCESDPQQAYTRGHVHDLVRFIVAACAWLRQRVLVTGDGHIERHARRRLEREHHELVPSTVKVVQLRRTEPQPDHRETATPVEWSCRWIVDGHWRNQPYANGEHKLIYILPFVKGPADKPLRVPNTTVYAVSR